MERATVLGMSPRQLRRLGASDIAILKKNQESITLLAGDKICLGVGFLLSSMRMPQEFALLRLCVRVSPVRAIRKALGATGSQVMYYLGVLTALGFAKVEFRPGKHGPVDGKLVAHTTAAGKDLLAVLDMFRSRG